LNLAQQPETRGYIFFFLLMCVCFPQMTVAIDGGEAGQEVAPVEIAGCYAPGGRYPLPSSVLMGAVTARFEQLKTKKNKTQNTKKKHPKQSNKKTQPQKQQLTRSTLCYAMRCMWDSLQYTAVWLA
jgi:hypothetical protein